MAHDNLTSTTTGLTVSDLRVQITTNRGTVEAISEVSFGISAGECIGLVGESGSGKSLLTRAIMGLTPPNVSVSGSVRIDSRETVGVSSASRRGLWGTTFAMVFQDPMTALSPTKRIGEHLVGPIRYHTQTRTSVARARALTLLKAVGISDPKRRMNQYPHELSGGMRQRVVIALAVANQPRFLFADEPTTALDVTMQAQVLDLLDAHRRETNSALLLCSHDLGVVAGRTNAVIVMYAGQVVEMGRTDELFSRPHMPYTEALLQSTPSVTEVSHTRLKAIPGRPPSLTNRPTGCRFAPRCSYATGLCKDATPPLAEAEPGRFYRCWHPRHTSSVPTTRSCLSAAAINGGR